MARKRADSGPRRRGFITVSCRECGENMKVAADAKGGMCWRCTHESIQRLSGDDEE